MGIRAVMKKYPLIVLCIIITHVSASNHPLMQKIFTQALTRWSFGTPCPRDWTLFNSYCYLVNSSIKNWHQAQAYCHELEGELVKINSLEENEFVLALARKQAPSVEQVWIGLKRDPRINNFMWSDHSIPVYTNWAPNEPNGGEAELCGHMYTRRTDCLPNRASGYWNDLRCDAIRPGWHCGLVCKRLP